MQVILLEKNKKLGDVGDVATVKNGYARNFLIPSKKAIQATKENLEVFKERKDIIHKEVEQKKSQAESVVAKLSNKWVYILKQAGEDGRLYGSVNSAEIVKIIKEQLKEEGLHKNDVKLLEPIKYLGSHNIAVNIFADIYAKVNVMIARTKEEAEMEIKDALTGKTKEKEKIEAKEEKVEGVSKEETVTDSSENSEQSKEPKVINTSEEKSTAPKKAKIESKSE